MENCCTVDYTAMLSYFHTSLSPALMILQRFPYVPLTNDVKQSFERRKEHLPEDFPCGEGWPVF